MKNFLLPALAAFLLSCNSAADKATPHDTINIYYYSQIDSIELHLQALGDVVQKGGSLEQIHRAFGDGRKHWKHIETLTEYYFANVSEAVNGPALPEQEDYDAKLLEPTGFQVIEEYIFPAYDTAQRVELLREIATLQATVPRLRQLYESNKLSDANVFEAARLELLRVMSLGISGFDSPIAQRSVTEARSALHGLRHVLAAYPQEASERKLNDLFLRADQVLQAGQPFNSFDRAGFIRTCLIPLSKEIYIFQQRLQVPNNKWLGAIDMWETNFADAAIFQPSFFAPQATQELTQKRAIIDLGRTLFFDPVLSGNNARACASCHQPARAFTDGATKSVAFGGAGAVTRNAPTLINAAFQRGQFADSRVAYLEDQITDVMHSPNEMHGNVDDAARKLMKSEAYQAMFANAFGNPSSQAISGQHIRIVLASYIRSLNAFNSRFDRFMRGENTLAADEIYGFNLFMGKAKCGTCHFMPLFNGSVPPAYVETESEVLGVPANADTLHATTDADEGKALVSQKSIQHHMFKTSTVRNASLTAPYMHNGIYTTLEQVIDFYNRGGGAGLGIQLDNQTLPPDALQLTATEKKQIVLFIGTLTDTTGLGRKPASLPRIDDPTLNKRKLGGEY